eukprot:218623_1
MGAEPSVCAPISDLVCVKENENDDDEQKAKAEFISNAQHNEQQTNITPNIKLKLRSQIKKAIACLHLIGAIITRFFESVENKCDQMPDGKSIDTASILSNILLIGSGPRDYLLGRPMNEILLAINTRELTKLHLMHLRAYHKTEESQNANSQCILWRMYLNRFMNHDFAQIVEQKKYEYITECDYNILNAYFVVEYILAKHIWSELRDKLSIDRDEVTKIYECQIIDTMIQNDLDLDGQCCVIFDITDKVCVYQQLFGIHRHNEASKYKKRLSRIHSQRRSKLKELTALSEISALQETTFSDVPSPVPRGKHPNNVSLSFSVNALDFETPKNQLQRLDSLPAFQFRINDKPLNIGKAKRKNKAKTLPIELPFYEVKVREVMLQMDFTINTLMISLNDIVLTDDYDLKGKIKNGLDGHNALHDFQSKVLTHPSPEKAIESHGVEIYFWKIVRFGVLLKSWKIDEELIAKTKAKFDEYNLKKKECFELFVDMMFKRSICYHQSIAQYRSMLSIFEMFEQNKRLTQIMSTNQQYTLYFVEAIQMVKQKEIIRLFADQQYPVTNV